MVGHRWPVATWRWVMDKMPAPVQDATGTENEGCLWAANPGRTLGSQILWLYQFIIVLTCWEIMKNDGMRSTSVNRLLRAAGILRGKTGLWVRCAADTLDLLFTLSQVLFSLESSWQDSVRSTRSKPHRWGQHENPYQVEKECVLARGGQKELNYSSSLRKVKQKGTA